MNLLTQNLVKESVNLLGVDNYALYNFPKNENEFFNFFKPAKGVDDTGTITYLEKEEYPFDYETFINKFNEVRTAYELKEYQRQRAAEYPSFADQFDILYHGGYDAWKAEIDKVKEKYPKPE